MVTPEQRNRLLPPPPSEDRRPAQWFWVGYGDTDQIGVVQSATGSYSQGSIAGSEIPAVGAPVQFSPGDPLGRIVVGSPQGSVAQSTGNGSRDVLGLIGVQFTAQDPNNADGAAAGTLTGRYIGDQIFSEDTPTGTSHATPVTWVWTGSIWKRGFRFFAGAGAPGTIAQAQEGDHYTDTDDRPLELYRYDGSAWV
jgi:hypothetical protein